MNTRTFVTSKTIIAATAGQNIVEVDLHTPTVVKILNVHLRNNTKNGQYLFCGYRTPDEQDLNLVGGVQAGNQPILFNGPFEIKIEKLFFVFNGCDLADELAYMYSYEVLS